MSRRAKIYSTCCVLSVIGPQQRSLGKISTVVTELLLISLLDASGPHWQRGKRLRLLGSLHQPERTPGISSLV